MLIRKVLLLFALTFSFTFSANALCVKVKKANLRSGPGTKNQVTWEVFRYMPLRKLSKKGKWYKVKDFEGDEHWVFNKIVTSQFQCAVVKVKKANLRTGPGTKYKLASDLPNVEKYTVFKVLKIKGTWAQVEDSFGDSYWAARKLLWIH